MMASIPNVDLNGVSAIGTLVVVLYAHRTLGSSFEQAPIRHFCLTISLKVSWRRVVVFDA